MSSPANVPLEGGSWGESLLFISIWFTHHTCGWSHATLLSKQEAVSSARLTVSQRSEWLLKSNEQCRFKINVHSICHSSRWCMWWRWDQEGSTSLGENIQKNSLHLDDYWSMKWHQAEWTRSIACLFLSAVNVLGFYLLIVIIVIYACKWSQRASNKEEGRLSCLLIIVIPLDSHDHPLSRMIPSWIIFSYLAAFIYD